MFTFQILFCNKSFVDEKTLQRIDVLIPDICIFTHIDGDSYDFLSRLYEKTYLLSEKSTLKNLDKKGFADLVMFRKSKFSGTAKFKSVEYSTDHLTSNFSLIEVQNTLIAFHTCPYEGVLNNEKEWTDHTRSFVKKVLKKSKLVCRGIVASCTKNIELERLGYRNIGRDNYIYSKNLSPMYYEKFSSDVVICSFAENVQSR